MLGTTDTEKLADRMIELNNSFYNEPIVTTPVPFAFKLVYLNEGRARVEMDVQPGMLVGGVGIVNGGVMDTLANTASVYAAMSALPAGHTPRMNFSATNLRKALGGEILSAFAEVVEVSGSSVVVRFTVANKYNLTDVKVVGQAQYHKPPKH